MALPNAAGPSSFQPPLPASAPLVATPVPIANSNPATPVTSAATTPLMSPAVGTPTPSAAETPGPTEKQTDDETPEKEAESNADLIKQATALLEKMQGIPMLRGIRKEMTAALEPVHTLRTPRSGYRAVRYLKSIVEMTKKV